MPDIADALDAMRLQDLIARADMALNLWRAFQLAAERGDTDIIVHHAKQIRICTTTTLAVVKRLGNPEPDDDKEATRGAANG